MAREKSKINDTAIKKNGNHWLVMQVDWISCSVHGTEASATQEAKRIAKEDKAEFTGEI